MYLVLVLKVALVNFTLKEYMIWYIWYSIQKTTKARRVRRFEKLIKNLEKTFKCLQKTHTGNNHVGGKKRGPMLVLSFFIVALKECKTSPQFE